MIIRATKKLLTISRIKPVKSSDHSTQILPGDWYANTVNTGHLGKFVTLFFHNNAKITLVCPTKSLNVALNQLPNRVKNYLSRHNFQPLIDMFDLDSDIQIFTTNSRSTLSFMNKISSIIEWHLREADNLDDFDYDKLEEILSNYLFTINGKSGHYEKTIDILNRIKEFYS